MRNFECGQWSLDNWTAHAMWQCLGFQIDNKNQKLVSSVADKLTSVNKTQMLVFYHIKFIEKWSEKIVNSHMLAVFLNRK